LSSAAACSALSFQLLAVALDVMGGDQHVDERLP